MKHHIYADGQLLQVNKKFSQLKERQKDKIAQWLFEEYRLICGDSGKRPDKAEDEVIVDAVMAKIRDAKIWIPEREIWIYYRSRKYRMHKRLSREQSTALQSESTPDC